MSFNLRLKTSMIKVGLTQATLAKKIGVTRAAVSLWESSEDDTRFPSPKNLNKCAEALGVPPMWLRFGDPQEIFKQNKVAIIENLSILSPIPVLKPNEIGSWLRSKTPQGQAKMQVEKKESGNLFNIELDNDSMIDPYQPSNSIYPGTMLTFDINFDRNNIKSGSIVVAQFGMTDNFKIRQYQKDGNDELLNTCKNDIPTTKIDANVQIIAVCTYQGRKML